jgi:hypothetical protein
LTLPLVRLGQGEYVRDIQPEDIGGIRHLRPLTNQEKSMSLLDSLITSTTPAPPKMIVYGTPGVGKTTFAASAGALLLDCENGAGAVPGLTRTPYLRSWPEVEGWLRELAAKPPEGLGVIAIDTLDWLVQRIVEFVVMDLDKKGKGEVTNTLSSAHGGYFKAREIVHNIVNRDLLPMLNTITERGVAVILLAHAANTKMTTPEGFDVRLAAPDIPQWIAPTFIEWADAVLFAWRETDGSRVLTTEGTNTVTAKNRYGMPSRLGLSWSEVAGAIQREASVDAAASG